MFNVANKINTQNTKCNSYKIIMIKTKQYALCEELMYGMYVSIVLVKVTCSTLYTILNTIMNRKI